MWHLLQNETELRIHDEVRFGSEVMVSGVAISIGSTALVFRAPRSGSHRGEKMRYGTFGEEDVARARRIVQAVNAHDELVAALELCDTALCHVEHGMIVSGLPELQSRVRAALAKARGE